MMVEGGVHYI